MRHCKRRTVGADLLPPVGLQAAQIVLSFEALLCGSNKGLLHVSVNSTSQSISATMLHLGRCTHWQWVLHAWSQLHVC
jgi:hypothetical protein